MLNSASISLKPASHAGLRSADGAPEIDRKLAQLAHSEARARLEIGRVAVRFLAISAHNPLGFSRIGDYSRERLGISGRELQSFAFVASRLEKLPLIAAAFMRGEISWSQTRLLCAVGGDDSESTWLVRARGLTMRELVQEIRIRSNVIVGDAGEALDEESDSTEGEPRVRFSVPCPRRVTLLWRRAVELARRMLGSQAPVWKAAEAIVAEVSSATPIEVDSEFASETAVPDVPRLARVEIEEKEPVSVADLDGMDRFALDTEMRELVRMLQSIDAEIGAVLRRVVDLRIHRALGFASFDQYVHERLGISPAKARALVAVERRARECPELASAYRSGALSWVRALTISPVVVSSSDWVTRTREVPVRRLQDEVEWALDMRDAYGRPTLPPELDAELPRPDLQTCARLEDEPADQRVTFFGPASVVALFRAGVSELTLPHEPQWTGLERLLLHAITEWEAQPKHRNPIFARDGWRCTVPCCSGRQGLHDHHIEYRSRGGGNEQWNRTAVCAAHHLHAVHLNLVGAKGRAPDDIVWELGLRPGREPLMRIQGERYL